MRRDLLGHGVDRVGAHRIAGVDDQMSDDHRAAKRVEDPHLDIAEAAAEFHQQRIAGPQIALISSRFSRRRSRASIRIGHVHSLHLHDHQGAGDGCSEAVIVGLARGIADCRHHR